MCIGVSGGCISTGFSKKFWLDYTLKILWTHCSQWHQVMRVQCDLDYPDLVYPENALIRMRRRRGQWYFVGVVTYWVMSYRPCRLGLSKTGLLYYFSEYCWPWSCCIGIIYRLGIINQVKNVGTSVIWTFHLSGMAALNLWTKGSG